MRLSQINHISFKTAQNNNLNKDNSTRMKIDRENITPFMTSMIGGGGFIASLSGMSGKKIGILNKLAISTIFIPFGAAIGFLSGKVLENTVFKQEKSISKK